MQLSSLEILRWMNPVGAVIDGCLESRERLLQKSARGTPVLFVATHGNHMERFTLEPPRHNVISPHVSA